ncbi:hypothetical protein ANME2D_01682 [Candidatus Methanoperedens nitroreducens]|uniref:Uncharacterized protein n=1 Tax=Candidatus Methanoperedens nitratireducens TaxID=1392998 RepID=A0A062V4K7_9EURY|nr:hypothetical protein ANME2D_01682 [Candidatus Methanoperedens nitroreducens]
MTRDEEMAAWTARGLGKKTVNNELKTNLNELISSSS